jgi:ribosomal protein S18 acetylase RimI-like enzyme
MNFEIRPIEPGDSVAGFSLGDALHTPLKTFLTKHAKRYHEQGLAFTYCIFDQGKNTARAYMTLVCGEVAAEPSTGPAMIDYRYPHYPAVKIARLAVHKDFRTYRFGQKLVSLALGISKGTIAQHVGCRFLVVDAKRGAIGFYEKCGFTLLDTAENRKRESPVMFVDLAKL